MTEESPAPPPPDLLTIPPGFPTTGALCGLDYGTKRIGVAVSDYEQKFAGTLEVYQPRNERLDGKHFLELASENRLAGWVVGLPIFKSGDESPQSKLTRQFGDWLSATTKLPVAYQDERHSSVEAEVLMWQQGVNPKLQQAKVDKIAALVILQSFLDARRQG